jgi:hypothetical protein
MTPDTTAQHIAVIAEPPSVQVRLVPVSSAVFRAMKSFESFVINSVEYRIPSHSPSSPSSTEFA